MEVWIRQGKGKQVEARARFHRVICDEPFDQDGTDNGMTPPEMMLSAVGSSAMYHAREYLQSRNLPANGVELKLAAEQSGSPPRFEEVAIDVDAPGLTPRTREGLLKAIETCLLTRTLASGARLNVRLTTAVAESQPPTGAAQPSRMPS